MDFHFLSRRELQALCKKNKIPANLTNVAMADALQALQLVEGIDEIILASQSSTLLSPKKTIPGSSDTTLTACRTSVRKKPTSIVSESPQLLNHTRRTTRRSVAEEANEEIRNLDLLQNSAISTTRRKATAASAKKKTESQVSENENDDKPAPLGNINVPETPAMESCQSRVQGASSRTKIQAQKEEKSVQRVYSTRRSVRLLEQSMEKLNLKEELCVEHITIDGLCNETQEVKEVIDVSGIDLLTTSEESLQNLNDLKVLPSLDNVYDVNLDIMKGNKQDLVSMLDEEHESDESSIQIVVEAGNVENVDFAPASSLDMPERENEFAGWTSEAQIDEEGTEDPEVAKFSNYRLGSHVESQDKNSVNIADEMFSKALEFSYVGHHFPLHETMNMGNVEESIITNTLSIRACDDNEIAVTVEKRDLPLGNFFQEQPEIRNETKIPGIVFKNESCMGVAENLVLSPSYATSGSSDQSQKKEVLEELLDIEHESLCKQISPCKQLDSAGRVTATLQNLFPCPVVLTPGKSSAKKQTTIEKIATLQNLFPCPVVLTPGKSSAKKQTKIEKIVHDSAINKEDVSNGRKTDPNVEKANKNENTLDEMSLRQLTKMLKEKLQIANKKNEDKDIKQVEQRSALQTLAENCMPAPHQKGRKLNN